MKGHEGMQSRSRHGRRRTESPSVHVTGIAIVSFSWRQLRACRARQKAGSARRDEGRVSGWASPSPSSLLRLQQLVSYARQHQQATSGVPVPLCTSFPLTAIGVWSS